MAGATSLKASTLEAPELVACFSSTSTLRLPFAPSLYGHFRLFVVACRYRCRAILDDPVIENEDLEKSTVCDARLRRRGMSSNSRISDGDKIMQQSR
ncbi:hypothetical protein V6N13_038576 [Hibiscus sabdariffa]